MIFSSGTPWVGTHITESAGGISRPRVLSRHASVQLDSWAVNSTRHCTSGDIRRTSDPQSHMEEGSH